MILCKLIGHNWYYKDYDNTYHIADGKKLFYDRARKCSRCQRKEIKTPHDVWLVYSELFDEYNSLEILEEHLK